LELFFIGCWRWIVPKGEIWNVYELADGSRIFFKIVVKVFKVRNLNPMTCC